MSLTVKDLENLQAHYPDYRMELVNGKIVVMSLSSYESDEVAFRVGANFRSTSSCIRDSDTHCGMCEGCLSRRKASEQAGILDPAL